MWGVYGYFPFEPVLVSLHATRAEAEAEKIRLRDAGPHMGESYIVEDIQGHSYVRASVPFTKAALVRGNR